MNARLLRGRHVIFDPAALPAGGAIEDGAVAVEGDSVAAVGSYAELKARFPQAEELGSDRHVVMPGLVNSHHHGWGLTTLQLGAVDDYLEPWIVDFWCLHKPLDVYLDTLYANMKLIRSGVTTVLHAGYSRDWGNHEGETRAALRAYSDTGLRVAYGVHSLDRNTFVYQDDEEFLATLPADLAGRVRAALEELAPTRPDDMLGLAPRLCEEYADHPSITILLCAEGPEWCSDDLLRRIRRTANECQTGVHMHALE